MADTVRRRQLYPIAFDDGKRLPAGWTRTLTRARWTGEFRLPRKGEWYLSGNPVEAWQAPNDLARDFHIAELVQGRQVTLWG
jgi:hypothetical protein